MAPASAQPSTSPVTAALVMGLALVALARSGTPVPTTPAARAQPDHGGAAATAATAANAANAQPSPHSLRRLRDGQRLDPNTAGSADLQLLPGIGPALAGRIVAHRQAHGPFQRLSDLAAVRGIGPRTLQRLEGLVEVKTNNNSDLEKNTRL